MPITPKQLLLYAVTDRTCRSDFSLYEQVEAALAGGVTCVQLREKQLGEDACIREAIELRVLCHRFGVPLLINDNLTVAQKSGADGVHVGREDMPVAAVRAAAGSGFIIGATAKTVPQALAAAAAGASYLGVGALFPSPTKPHAIPVTKETLRDICRSVDIPVIAIGGITADNADVIRGSGAVGVAAVSAIFAAPDITAAAKRLKAVLLT